MTKTIKLRNGTVIKFSGTKKEVESLEFWLWHNIHKLTKLTQTN